MKYYFSNKPESFSTSGLNLNSNVNTFQTNWNVLLNYVSPEIEPNKNKNSSISLFSTQHLSSNNSLDGDEANNNNFQQPCSSSITSQTHQTEQQQDGTIDLDGLANTTTPGGMLIYTATSALTTKEWLSWSSSSSCESFETTGTDLNTPSSIESDSNGEHIKVS